MACGYSHERAANALMRELNRGDSSARPTDEEIFDIMRRYHIGSEDATKALVVSKAMRRALQSSESPAHAIQNLSQKISMSTLLYDSCDEDMESSIGPELRVEPVVSTRKLRRSSRSSTRSKAGRKRSIDEMPPIAEGKKKNANCKKETTRARSDSVAEEVAEKISVEASNNSNNTDTPLRTPVVRGKRSLRSEDGETQGHKRMRVSDQLQQE